MISMHLGYDEQATTSSPPTESLNGGEEEPEKASKPVMEFQNDPGDDEEKLCRICRSPGEEERPLYYPCACKGSMKFTHEDCLLQWLNYRSAQPGLNDEQCEICKHAFAVEYVYAENTCDGLIGSLIVLSMCFIVLSALLFVMEFTTAWLWRFMIGEKLYRGTQADCQSLHSWSAT